MKHCPNCRTNYDDDTLQFCLQDGTPLAKISDQNAAADNFDAESETIVSPKQVEPIRFDLPSSYQTNQTIRGASEKVVVEREPKKTNTAAIVLLSTLGTILLLGIGGVGVWLYLKNNKANVAVNSNPTLTNRQLNTNLSAGNQNSNVNLAVPSPTATPTVAPTAAPTINPQQIKLISEDVKNTVDDWKSATENLDLNTHLSQYADTVDYYRGGRVNRNKVRADKEKAYAAFDSININITNMKITPDASGEKATALFDKEWTFEGENKYSSGKVQQQLTLGKINGRWLITGEKDLKVYYVNN